MASNSHFGPKLRHFGTDAEIQAMDGYWPTPKCLIQSQLQTVDCHPWTLDSCIHAGMTKR